MFSLGLTRFVFLLCCFMVVANSALGQTPVSVTVLPNTVTSCSTATGYIAISSPTKVEGTIDLSVTGTGVTVPATVAIGKNEQSVSFKITTKSLNVVEMATSRASYTGGSAVGFLLLNANPVVLPSISGITFTPSIAYDGQAIKGTLTFTEPLPQSLTFDLSTNNSNFTVPTSIQVPAGANAKSFNVTTGGEATTAAVTVTANIVPCSYNNVLAGPFSKTGSFAFLAGIGLPPNYKAGFWVSQPRSSPIFSRNRSLALALGPKRSIQEVS